MGLKDTTSEQNVAANESEEMGLTYPLQKKFRFNKNQETGVQRESVEVTFPVPAYNGIVKILNDAVQDDATDVQKQTLKYLLETVAEAVTSQVRSYVSDNENASQATIPWNKFTFEAIANMPAATRGASAIAKELWEKFAKEYVAIMPSKSNVSAEVCATRVGVLVAKFRPLTGNPQRKDIITNLMNTLAVFIDSNPPSKDEFEPIFEFLTKKADELKAEDSVVTTEALGF